MGVPVYFYFSSFLLSRFNFSSLNILYTYLWRCDDTKKYKSYSYIIYIMSSHVEPLHAYMSVRVV